MPLELYQSISIDEVSIDPLYSMKNRINYVTDVSDLINVLATNPDAANDELRFYCDNVFTELDCSQLVSVVNSPPQY